MPFYKICFVTLCALACVGALQVVREHPRDEMCKNVPKPTVTFSTKCKNIDVTEKSCWNPHAPTDKDTIIFPSGTHATMPFAKSYTPVVAKNIIIDTGATILMNGGGMEANGCFSVQGQLEMFPDKVDEGSRSTVEYTRNPKQPMGTGCHTVDRGFTPRICGTGVLQNSGNVIMMGLYASLFIETVVKPDATLRAFNSSFLWGNVSNYGTLHSQGNLYLHGFLYNYAQAKVEFVRADKWAEYFVKSPSILIHNEGNLTFQAGRSGYLDFISTDIPEYGGDYKLKLINNNNVTFECDNQYGCLAFLGTQFNTFNFGKITWYYPGSWYTTFYVTGSTVNLGTLVGNGEMTIYLSDYLSDNGELSQKNGAYFHFGNSAGIDEKTIRTCEGKNKLRKPQPRKAPRHISLGTTEILQTNQSCDPSSWNSCPSPLCCGKSGVCETARCQNVDGYGGGPMCCPDNTFCGGSSHGAYCGGGAFVWEVDADCLEDLTFVDRYEYDAMVKHFAKPLPKFGRYRYSFRGKSTISGDGSRGGVVFTEPIEILGTLVLNKSSTLRCLIDNGNSPIQGSGIVEVGSHATYFAGIKTVYSHKSRFHVHPRGNFAISRYSSVQLQLDAWMTFDSDSQFVVDGQLMVTKAPQNNVKQCGSFVGRGTVIGEELRC